MPHVSSSGGDDLCSTDEVKVFKDEGDGEDEKRSSENLTEEKSSLIDLTESEEKSGGNYSSNKNAVRPDHSPVFGKVEPAPHTSSFNMGYLMSPYSYANGAAGPIQAGKMGLGPTHPGAALPFFCNGDPLSQPPPAHMGIPPYQLDGKAGTMGEFSPGDWRRLGPLLAATGLTRPPMYPFSAGQYPYPMLSPEMSQVAASWHTPSMYPLSPSAGFRSPYPTTLPISTSSLPTDLYRFSPTSLIPTHPGLSPHGPHLGSHPAIVTPGPKQELPDLNHRYARIGMDGSDEPLNLTIKKKPVAIVAPSSIVDTNQNFKTTNNNKGKNDHDFTTSAFSCEKYDEAPQDLSLKKQRNDYPNNLSIELNKFDKETYNDKLNSASQEEKFLSKCVNEMKNNYNKKSFMDNIKEQELKTNIMNSVYKANDLYESFNSKNLVAPENIYSMINYLAEHKFLTAWYMNSVFAGNLGYPTGGVFQQHASQHSNNSILNNLLDKKVAKDDRPTLNFDTLIKNEMSKECYDAPSKNGINMGFPTLDGAQLDQKNSVGDNKNNQDGTNAGEKKKPHIKKPLNAFMLYMKEMRAKVVAECTLKESAAINQILGRRWHALGREEQAKYYELARRERQLHMQLYPDWSSRANASRGKKRKRKQDPADGGNNMKKCRARYGLDQQSQWCKPCRRKKKCIRYLESGDGNDGNQSDDNLGSCGSVGDAHTPPEEDGESLSHSMSSPGGLSGLSSLTSPGGIILPSPSTSVASPSVSAASPYMLQSPLTPHEAFECKLPPAPPLLHQQPPRNPVGTNPHDINNPLSVNQLTGQCVKNEPPDGGGKDPTRSIISVT